MEHILSFYYLRFDVYYIHGCWETGALRTAVLYGILIPLARCPITLVTYQAYMVEVSDLCK